MTPSKRTTIEKMAGAAVPVILGGKTYQARPLGFGASCLWLEKAMGLEREMRASLPEHPFDSDGKPSSPEVSEKLLRWFPRMAEMIFEFLGLPQDERDSADQALGLDLDRSIQEVAAAYFELQAIANPSRAAQMRKAKAGIREPPTTTGGRESC
jgi:hypothetical protein